MYNPKKRVPATVEFTDIIAPAQDGRAGARRRRRLQERRRARARRARVSRRRRSRTRRARSIPARDAQAMEDELILADLGVAERRLERIEKDLKKGRSTELEKERDLVQRCKVALEEGKPLRALQLTGDDLKRLRGFQFLSAKPLLLVINLDEADIADVGADVETRRREDRASPAFLAHAATKAVALCAKIELEIAQLEGDDAKAFLSDLGLTESGLDRVIRTTYDLLGYMSFFTVGEDECRAWSIARGTRGAARRRRDSQRHPARLHPRRSRRLRRADRPRLDGRLPRPRRGPPRRQGIRRPGRRYHQLPICHLSDVRRIVVAEAQVPFVHGRRGAARPLARRRAAAPRLRGRARRAAVPRRSRTTSCWRKPPPGGCSICRRATASRSIC